MINAVLMAAGMGTRMRPLTIDTPKPLIPVCGIPMINTVIQALERAGVRDIYIVSGYLGGQFDEFADMYNDSHTHSHIFVLHNPYYETVNNISSIYIARDILRMGDCFICEADLYVQDEMLLANHPDHSCYYGKYKEGYVNDWGFETGSDGFIVRVKKGVTDTYNMVGISYLKAKEAASVADAVEKMYGTEGYENLFWDDVVDRNLDHIKLKVWPIADECIDELDTVEELRLLEKRLSGPATV